VVANARGCALLAKRSVDRAGGRNRYRSPRRCAQRGLQIRLRSCRIERATLPAIHRDQIEERLSAGLPSPGRHRQALAGEAPGPGVTGGQDEDVVGARPPRALPSMRGSARDRAARHHGVGAASWTQSGRLAESDSRRRRRDRVGSDVDPALRAASMRAMICFISPIAAAGSLQVPYSTGMWASGDGERLVERGRGRAFPRCADGSVDAAARSHLRRATISSVFANESRLVDEAGREPESA